MTEDYFRIFLHVHNSTHHARLHWFTTACSLGQSDRHLPLNISKSESPQSCPNLLYLLTLPSQEIKISSCSVQSQNLESPFFTFSPTWHPMCQIVLWTPPSQYGHYFLTLSLLFIHTVHSGISSPLDCHNNTVALNGALFSTPNRDCMSMNGDFVFFMSWEGSFAKISAKYPAIHRTCPRKHRIIFSKMPVVLC